jgi:hypothetical protein
MTEQELLQNLVDALSAAIDPVVKSIIKGDREIQAARAAFERIGLRITDLEVIMRVSAQAVTLSRAVESDADFLRSLRIAPDLTSNPISGEPR